MAAPAAAPEWRVLFDLNVVLDVLLQRQPHVAPSANLWALVETGQVQGYLAAHSLTTLFYLYRRQAGAARAAQAVRKLLQVFAVAPLDKEILSAACDLSWNDFEDAVQAVAAQRAGCAYLVTRNPKDFQGAPLNIITPGDFLAVWTSTQPPEERFTAEGRE